MKKLAYGGHAEGSVGGGGAVRRRFRLITKSHYVLCHIQTQSHIVDGSGVGSGGGGGGRRACFRLGSDGFYIIIELTMTRVYVYYKRPPVPPTRFVPVKLL